MLQTPRPTPPCAHFRVTKMPCTKCGYQMRLGLSELRSSRFDLITYSCVSCDCVESFLMAIRGRCSKRGWTMQYAIPFVATAALIVGVAIPFAVAAALFAGALTVARAQQNPPA
jgi:hypothetical protein